MSLLAAGMVLAGALIWHGAGAPQEPARVVVPVDRQVHLASPGTYIVFTELVVAPQALPAGQLRAPEISLELRSGEGEGTPVEISPPGLGTWFYKVLTKGRGHTLGRFEIERAGDFRVEADLVEVAGRRPDRTVVLAFARAGSPGRFLWLLLGFAGQICFSLRFLIQWLASEKAGRSTVPRAFWYYSLVGGLMILAYAIYTRDPVFILAFAFNAFIYVRNLVLIRREDRAAAGAEEAPSPADGPAQGAGPEGEGGGETPAEEKA
ncbi:MAG: lipid-A-disaccharide synthase N-terminal domain-containing protein [Planctomycetota bacterium]|jgi:lipid-A-disaccharide synthase-like uncharacterized protein